MNQKELPITDARILNIVNTCLEDMKRFGLAIKKPVRFVQDKTFTQVIGQARYIDNTVAFNPSLLKESEYCIKRTTYHELAHLYCREHYGENCNHDRRWKRTVAYITQQTGIEITTCSDTTDMPHFRANLQSKYKYTYRCKCCGAIVGRMRESEFTRTYNEKMHDGASRWVCAKCGGSFERIK